MCKRSLIPFNKKKYHVADILQIADAKTPHHARGDIPEKRQSNIKCEPGTGGTMETLPTGSNVSPGSDKH